MTRTDARAAALVYVVDDDEAVRRSLGELIRAAGFQVAAFSSARAFLEAFDPGAQGCVVTDVRLPDLSGVEIQEELARRGCEIPVNLITGYADVPTAVRSMRAGAVDFLEKPLHPTALLERVREAVDRDRVRRRRNAERREIRARLRRLTAREREVLDLVVAGHTSKEIAARLGLSPKTVHVYRAEARAKLGARSIAELTRLVVTASASN